jgi:phosphoserine aminotransferase
MNKRVINFSAGPAMLPESVLKRAAAEMLDWRGLGMSVMEISHRSEEFEELLQAVEDKYRQIFSIPHNYKVLFLPGGAQSQFFAIPMNLLRGKKTADYVHSGVWSGLAINEAKKYCDVNVIASGEQSHFFSIPDFNTWKLNPEAAYFYYCPNETITGLQIPELPEVKVPLVADLTSSLGTTPIDVTRYGVIVASAKKNLGQAGVTIVIVREDLMGDVLPITPNVYDYKKQADNQSRVNTPPTYAIYMMDLMLDWMKEQGGLTALEKANRRKASLLYNYLEQSDFYRNEIDPRYRSFINVTFNLPTEELTQQFLKEAKQESLVNLKGHKKLGGIRVNLYNAVTEEMVAKLIDFMQDFVPAGQ